MASEAGATVSGGNTNTASDLYATVGGGRSNTASGADATVGGGQNNTASGGDATVGGGFSNDATGNTSTVGGGTANKASGNTATVGGGTANKASGIRATVGGGDSNTASGLFATVPGGTSNKARGQDSFAVGRRSRANHRGTFVWNDGSGFFNTDTLASTAKNQFLARASGGFFFYTGAAPNLTPGASLPAGSGTWGVLSSKASKTNFDDVDARSYLDRLASLDLKEWSYKTEGGVTHVGPMAEDFYAAFGHGPSEKSISTVDADGVALAAIQGLYELVKELQAEVKELRAELR